MVVSEPGLEVELGTLNRVQHLGDHIYRFSFRKTNFQTARTKDYSFTIREVHFTQDNRCYCCTDYFEDSKEYVVVCKRIDLLSQIEEPSVCIDGKFELKLVP